MILIFHYAYMAGILIIQNSRIKDIFRLLFKPRL